MDIKQQKIALENKLKQLECNLNNDENLKLYHNPKNELESIYDHIAEGIRIRSRIMNTEKNQQNSF